MLPCGCKDIPWPLIHGLGQNFVSIICDLHGLVKITKAHKKVWRDVVPEALSMENVSKDDVSKRMARSETFADVPPY